MMEHRAGEGRQDPRDLEAEMQRVVQKPAPRAERQHEPGGDAPVRQGTGVGY